MKAKDRLVLDCSVALAWCFHDETAPYADALAAHLPKLEVYVPGLWPLEIANALVVGERRKRCTPADILTWTGFLSSLPITIDDQTPTRAWGDTLHLARAHHLSAYDAAYLELAIRCGGSLATLDDKLKAVAGTIGIALYKV